MIIEICSNSLQSALNAQKAGANRIELCSELSIGGVTPSAATIALVRKHLDIDVFVLIRPRGGHFCYTDLEFEVIQEEVKYCQAIGCDGVVIGVLKPDGTVDIERMKVLVDLARPMQVTFHRAFDVCKNPLEALEQLIELGVDRILTSGQQNKAIHGIELLEQLVKQANGRTQIMAGSGVNAKNTLDFKKIGIEEVHFSASSALQNSMTFIHPDVQFETHGYQLTASDVLKIKEVIERLK